jgi:hypothetical protein
MYKAILSLFLALFIFSCATTIANKSKLNKFMDPDTGVETVENIIAFNHGTEQDLVSFNQTKNPKNISWYIICKFCKLENRNFESIEIITDNKRMSINVGGSYNSFDVKTMNSNIFREVEYFKINETNIADLNKCNNLTLIFKGEKGVKELVFDYEQIVAIKDWIKNITIPK